MIKNIIFDFGDIFINLDKVKFAEEIQKLGIPQHQDEVIQILHKYEMGLVSTDYFLSYFHETYHIDKEALVTAWNSILLDFPKKRFDFLKDLMLSNKYRLFLLSNTNDLHISWIKKNWGFELYNDFKNCFEQFYLSHEIHFRKPNPDIYDFVLTKNQLKVHETFFIDDTKENTDAASKLGIHVWNLNPKNEDVTELFLKHNLN